MWPLCWLEKLRKLYKPALFLVILVVLVLGIAGCAVTTWDAESWKYTDNDQPEAALGLLLAEAKVETILGQQMKKAQDLFIAVVIMSVLALVIGVAAHMGAGSNSTKYEVNEKRDKEKKGVDNSGYEGKKDADIEKGDEKDEKWKNNYVPYDDESKEKETN